MKIRWDDPKLLPPQERKGAKLRARYRLLQSYYRENVLGLEASIDPTTNQTSPTGNFLPQSAMRTGVNFLTPAALECVRDREAIDKGWGGGMMNKKARIRLYRNMLSSQPLCFNLFGELRWYPAELARALTKTTEQDVAAIVDVRVEWAPQNALGGASADALIRYVDGRGRRCFLAVETKYTEDLKPYPLNRSQREKYRRAMADARSGFDARKGGSLLGTGRQQFLINAIEMERLSYLGDVDHGSCLVLHLAEDDMTSDAASEVGLARSKADGFVEPVSYQSLLRQLRGAGLGDWKKRFVERYLDLGPIQSTLESRGAPQGATES